MPTLSSSTTSSISSLESTRDTISSRIIICYGIESRVDADDEPAEDEEEVGVGVLGGDHAHPAHRHQDVVQQQAALWNDVLQGISDEK